MHITINYWKLCFIYCRFLVYLFLKESSPKKIQRISISQSFLEGIPQVLQSFFTELASKKNPQNDPFWTILGHIKSHSKARQNDWVWRGYISWTPQVDIGFLEPHLQHTFGDKMISLQDPQFQICFHLIKATKWQASPHHFWDFQTKL